MIVRVLLRQRPVAQALYVRGSLDAHLLERLGDAVGGAQLREPRAGEEVILVLVVWLPGVHHRLEVVVDVLGHLRRDVPPLGAFALRPLRRVVELILEPLEDPIVVVVVVVPEAVVVVVVGVGRGVPSIASAPASIELT